MIETTKKEYSAMPAALKVITVPEDLTLRQGIAALYLLQHWEAAHRGRMAPYGAGFLYRAAIKAYHGLQTVSRDTALHHHATGVCFVCETPVDLARSTLDHLLAKSQGGPETLANAVILCRRCNSSKGAKDLLEWWLFKAFPVPALPRTILCLYARIHWQVRTREDLAAPAPSALQEFLAHRSTMLPTDDHRETLYGAAYVTCCYRFWEGHRNGR